MKLYGSLTSPYVRKVRILLAETELPCEFIVEGPADETGNVARLNPLGKVPVLVTDGGEVYFDSPLIMEYLDALSNTSLLPADEQSRWAAKRWHVLAQGMLDATVTRLLESRRPAEKQMPEAIRKQERKIAAALSYADSNWGGGEYLVEERFTVADLAFGVALEYLDFRYTAAWREQYPRLATWHRRIAQRPSFRQTVPPPQ